MAIFKLLGPQLKKNLKMIISMMIIGAIGIAIIVGLMGSYVSLNNQIYGYINDYELQDITIDTSLGLESTLNIDELKKVEGVKSLDTRIVYDVSISYNDKSSTSRIITTKENSFPILKADKEIDKSNEKPNIVVESSYASSLGVSLGDVVSFSIGSSNIDGYVYKIGSTPECLSVKRNKWIMGGSGSFGVIFIDEDELTSFGLKGFYNQIIVLKEDNFTNKQVSDNLKKVSNVEFNNVTLYEDSSVAEKIDYNLHPLIALSTIVPVLFFAVSLIINALFMYQMVSHYKKEIGITLTMGYSKKDIYKLFFVISLISALGAIALGIGLGYGIECFAYGLFAGAFNMSFTVASIDGISTLIAVLISLIVFVLAGLFDTFRIVHYLTPIEAISETTSSKVRGLKLGKLSPRIKIEINRLIRNYKTVLISIFCITISFSIMFAGVSFRHSKNLILDDLFNKRMAYDASAYLTESISDDELNKIRQVDGVTKAERLVYTITQMEANSKSVSVLIYGISPSNDMVKILDDNHNITSLPSEGITVDSSTASSLGIKIGDTIKVSDEEILVSKIATQDMLHVQYMSEEDLLKIAPSSYSTSVLINTTNNNALKKYLNSREDLALLKFTSDIKNSTTKTFKNSDAGIYIILVIGVVMGMVIIFNMNLMSLEVEKRSYAVKLSMGFSVGNVSKSLIIEDIIKIIVSVAIGIGLGRVFTILVLNQMSTATATYPYQDSFLVYLIAIILVVGFMLISRLITIIKIKRLNIAELIKDKE